MGHAGARDRARRLIPPLLLDVLRSWRGTWRYDPRGWPAAPMPASGWSARSVAESYEARERGTAITDELPVASAHNTLMCFAYVLGRAAWSRSALDMLDYGGGTGAYFDHAQSLYPELGLRYTCMDLPSVVAVGRRLRPHLHFVDSAAEAFGIEYDLVVASSSLHYSRDWRSTVHALAGSTRDFAYFTRIPIVTAVDSFVVHQRAYGTEYPGWFLNRGEFLSACEGFGLRLEREFPLDERPVVRGAPEQAEYRGFLFRKSPA